jgi:hypothetical protein
MISKERLVENASVFDALTLSKAFDTIYISLSAFKSLHFGTSLCALQDGSIYTLRRGESHTHANRSCDNRQLHHHGPFGGAGRSPPLFTISYMVMAESTFTSAVIRHNVL